jgi:polysaccharide export outer membrane protein
MMLSEKYTRIYQALFIHIALMLWVCYPANAVQSRAYRIGPQDEFVLSIYAGGKIQHEVKLKVSNSGMIKAPLIGAMKAQGLTVAELEEEITQPLAKDYFVNPQVNIIMQGYHSLQYYISGAVASPGMYEMSAQASLMELIAKAGGATPQRGNVAFILRTSVKDISKGENITHLISRKEPIKVDLTQLLDKGDMSSNVMLQTGDVVYIPLQEAINVGERNVYVEGEVKRRGVYKYSPGLTALNLCIIAGGFSKFAAPNRTKIFRKKENSDEILVIKVNLEHVSSGKIPDVELKPGDRVSVPETWL